MNEITVLAAEKLAKLAASRHVLAQKVSRAADECAKLERIVPPADTAKAAIERIRSSVSGCVTHLRTYLRHVRHELLRDLRLLRSNDGIKRLVPYQYDLLAFMGKFVGFTVVEGIAAGFIIGIGGSMAPFEAFAYGLVFAAALNMVGVAAGFFGWRYIPYRQFARTPVPTDALIRNAAKYWFYACLVIGVYIILIGVRVRATGGHTDIFDFQSTPLLASFSNGLSNLVVVIALLGFVASIYEGVNGILDRPDFNRRYEQATDGINGQAFDVASDQIEAVESLVDETLERLEDARQDATERANSLASEIQSIKGDMIEHNRLVGLSASNVLEQAERVAYVEGISVSSVLGNVDMQAFDAQMLSLNRLAEIPIPSVDDDVWITATNRIQQARSEAIQNVERAYDEFISSATTDMKESYEGGEPLCLV